MIGLGAAKWFLFTGKGRTVGAIVLAVLALGWWTMWNRNDAAGDAVSEIERVNNELSTQAIDAREALRRCYSVGGVWDFGATRCKEKPQDNSGD
jgi:hypothetical protein